MLSVWSTDSGARWNCDFNSQRGGALNVSLLEARGPCGVLVRVDESRLAKLELSLFSATLL